MSQGIYQEKMSGKGLLSDMLPHPSRMYNKKLTIHDKFLLAFKNMAGQRLLRSAIIVILSKKFPNMPEGSMQPFDHDDIGNKGACWCAGTDSRIFDRIGETKPYHYRVRPNLGLGAGIHSHPTPMPSVGNAQGPQKTRSEVMKLWNSNSETEWKNKLNDYWEHVKPKNMALEKELNKLNLNVRQASDIGDWYQFLLNKYIPWKYTDPRYQAKVKKLFTHEYSTESGKQELDKIAKALFQFNCNNIREGLSVARSIKGFGIAGASGLLSLLFPEYFGTVDQFVIKALRDVKTLPAASALQRINCNSITLEGGVTVVKIMIEKAEELNVLFGSTFWTPRRIDMTLWAIR